MPLQASLGRLGRIAGGLLRLSKSCASKCDIDDIERSLGSLSSTLAVLRYSVPYRKFPRSRYVWYSVVRIIYQYVSYRNFPLSTFRCRGPATFVCAAIASSRIVSHRSRNLSGQRRDDFFTLFECLILVLAALAALALR